MPSPADLPPLSDADRVLLADFADMLLLEHGLSRNSLAAYQSDLGLYGRWLAARGRGLLGADEADLREYLADRQRRADPRQPGQGFNARSQARHLTTARRFYRWLVRERRRADDPTRLLEAPRQGRGLPKTLAPAEVERLLAAPDDSPQGLRDRAMLELMYASGLRVSELVGLPLPRVNLQRGLVLVLGKGGRERLVPMGEVAQQAIQRWLQEARPDYARASRGDALFLSNRGEAMTRHNFWHRIKHYARLAGISAAALSPHTLRHAFATHLLENGADLRAVQSPVSYTHLTLPTKRIV